MRTQHYQEPLDKQEYVNRVGEEYAEEYGYAHRIYQAFPNMSKETFCYLWRFDKLTNLNLFDGIDEAITEYEQEKKNNPTFARYCVPFHESDYMWKRDVFLSNIASVALTGEKI